MDRRVANGSLEATCAPANALITFDDEEGYARRERCGAINERLKDVCLGLQLVNFRDGCLNNSHIA